MTKFDQNYKLLINSKLQQYVEKKFNFAMREFHNLRVVVHLFSNFLQLQVPLIIIKNAVASVNYYGVLFYS